MRIETEHQVGEALSGGEAPGHGGSKLQLSGVSSEDPSNGISRDALKVSKHGLALRDSASPYKGEGAGILGERADEGAIDGEAGARRPHTTFHLAVAKEALRLGRSRAHPAGPVDSTNTPGDAQVLVGGDARDGLSIEGQRRGVPRHNATLLHVEDHAPALGPCLRS
jgi:hypothetical protein